MAEIAGKYLSVPKNDAWIGGSSAGQRIGLYGGSFNPPHAGHLLVAETALRRLRLDAVWWLVSPGNPLKDNRALLPLQNRLAASEALTENPRIVVTAFEKTLNTSVTAEMLRQIVPLNPQTHFVWIMGADNLIDFHLWQDWQQIMSLVPLAVVNRPGFNNADKTAPAAKAFAASRISAAKAAALPLLPPPVWVFLRGKRSYLSSTELREKAQQDTPRGHEE